MRMLPGSFQILGQEYHRNEYRFHKTLRQANFFIDRQLVHSVEGAKKKKKQINKNKKEGLSHDHLIFSQNINILSLTK